MKAWWRWGVVVMLGLPSLMLAQADSSPVDSIARYPILRVRSLAEGSGVDSLWSDSAWVWSGACDGPLRSFRFEFPDSTFSALEFPCMLQATAPSDLNAPLTSASDASPSQAWTAEVSVSLEDLQAMSRTPLAASCFPPAESTAFEALLSAMEQAVFETEKCAVLVRASETLCLTRSQMRQALDRIASEDRKLETLERIYRSDIEWTEAELRELFQLNFILEQALKRFTKR